MIITGKELGGLLFSIHGHLGRNGDIIYYEDDLLRLFKKIGLPDPEWGETY